MMGQHGHFALYADQTIEYAIARYRHEVLRLFTELDRRLSDRDYICDDYSVVDMATWPWVLTWRSQNIDLDAFRNVRRWYDLLKQRPALRRGYDLMREKRSQRGSEAPDAQARRHLFGSSEAIDRDRD